MPAVPDTGPLTRMPPTTTPLTAMPGARTPAGNNAANNVGADDVVLLDDQGRPCGRAPRLQVHGGDTPLHLAFSMHLFDTRGRVLITRRALAKRTWPGVWTNSCCGHPRPGESVVAAVHRRVGEELGVTVHGLREVLPDFRYRAVDVGGVVENELCPVFVAELGESVEVNPDPDEIADIAWLEWSALSDVAASTPMLLSPWAAQQIPQLDARLDGLRS